MASDRQTDTNGTASGQRKSTPAIPDYLVSPNAVFKDEGVQWRYGKPPDYSKTRKVWEEGRSRRHAAGSLEEMVENLVKNWEVEASFKPRLSDWRTVNHEKYSFAMGGGPPQSAEHMIKVGTYNGIIAPNEYYSPENSDFASSHKTFKRMMPTFAWEVLEVYSGPPKVAFRWRHWGYMKNDYVGFNDQGQKVTAKAHGGIIDIEGVIVAEVDDELRLCALQTWMDPLEMFRQIAPHGVVNKEAMNRKVDRETALDGGSAADDGKSTAQKHNNGTNGTNGTHKESTAPEDVMPKHMSDETGLPADAFVPHQGADTDRGAPGASTTVTNSAQNGTIHNGRVNSHEAVSAQTIIDTAAARPLSMDLDSPTSNFHDALERLPAGQQQPSSAWQPAPPPPPPLQTLPRSVYTSDVTGYKEPVLQAAKTEGDDDDAVDEHLAAPAEEVHPQPKDVEARVQPVAGEAVAAPAGSEETKLTRAEMGRLAAGECPFLMNRE